MELQFIPTKQWGVDQPAALWKQFWKTCAISILITDKWHICRSVLYIWRICPDDPNTHEFIRYSSLRRPVNCQSIFLLHTNKVQQFHLKSIFQFLEKIVWSIISSAKCHMNLYHHLASFVLVRRRKHFVLTIFLFTLLDKPNME